jgi:hypothetical protein
LDSGALVGAFVLGADHHDPAAEALVPQDLGGLGPGKARPDDHECGFRGHCQLLVCLGHRLRRAVAS